MNEQRFDGRVALVTGGSSGIGAAVAQRLLAEGARVASLDLAEQAPEGVVGIAGDVSSSADVEAAVARVTSELGPVDVLVCSAGITGGSLRTVDVDDDEWRRVFAINSDGVFFCNRAVVGGMTERGYGRIVNVASIAGKEGNPNASHYSASKAGLIGFTKSLGKELAARNILANCITPAAANTEIFAQMQQAHIDYMRSRIPMGRFVEVDEIAALICWLASEDCSFSTGAVFDISGGRATY
jgi:2-dehydro-3-deoxy-L-rhamnonate dehydrogenase (NAD+)